MTDRFSRFSCFSCFSCFTRSIATCAVVMLLAAAPAGSATRSVGGTKVASTSTVTSVPPPAVKATPSPASNAAPPFARVYLATRGCMSCSHCRTNIRQMLKPKTKGADTKLGDDQIEVTYPTPQNVPLRDVIRSLADNRLHDLGLVDVLFEAGGTIRTAPDGAVLFEIAETGQPFPLSIDGSTARPADGTPVRLTSRVEGWRDKGTLSLRVREIRAAI